MGMDHVAISFKNAGYIHVGNIDATDNIIQWDRLYSQQTIIHGVNELKHWMLRYPIQRQTQSVEKQIVNVNK